MPQYDVRDNSGRKVGSVDYDPNRGALAEFLFLAFIFGIWAAINWWVRSIFRYPLIMIPVNLAIIGGVILLVNLPTLNKPQVTIKSAETNPCCIYDVTWSNGAPKEPVTLELVVSKSLDPDSHPGDIAEDSTVNLPAGSYNYSWTASGTYPFSPYLCARVRIGDKGNWTPYSCSG